MIRSKRDFSTIITQASLVISFTSQTDPDAANVVSLFQRGGTGISGSISVIDPSSETTYYWDINDDWAVVLTLQPSEVFILSDIS